MLIWMVCAAIRRYDEIYDQITAKGHVCVHGHAAISVYVDVHVFTNYWRLCGFMGSGKTTDSMLVSAGHVSNEAMLI